jgi:hypothetical protein
MTETQLAGSIKSVHKSSMKSLVIDCSQKIARNIILMDLYHYYLTQKGRNIPKSQNSFPVFERHFARFKGHPVTMFEKCGGGAGKPASFYERGKSLIDEMNARLTRGVAIPGPYGRNLPGISFYDNMAVIERTPFLDEDMLRFPVPLPA